MISAFLITMNAFLFLSHVLKVAVMHVVKLHLYFESHYNAVDLQVQAKPKLCMDCSLVNA